LEEVVAEALTQNGTAYLYEQVAVPFLVSEGRTYTPDFLLPNGIVVETKGRFVTADRKKHKLVKAQHPDLDLRFVFSNSRARISKQSATDYGKWARTSGFMYADRLIPAVWLTEPPNRASQDAILRLLADSNPERAEAALRLFKRKRMP
jgi:hypothetical protein